MFEVVDHRLIFQKTVSVCSRPHGIAYAAEEKLFAVTCFNGEAGIVKFWNKAGDEVAPGEIPVGNQPSAVVFGNFFLPRP